MSEQLRYVFEIPEDRQGKRLDSVLAALMDELSRTAAQKLIDEGRVQVNGRVETSRKYKVKNGEEIILMLEPSQSLEVLPENIPLTIVYEDESLLVVDKPRGLVVHPAPGNSSGTLVNALLYHCGDRLSTINGASRPGIVHRIDKDTSGLLMVAKTDQAHCSLAEQLAEHTVLREYRAICHGRLPEAAGTINAPIGRDPKNRLRMAVTPNNSKPAVTHYRMFEEFAAYTYLAAVLETGRTHQIRVHLAHIHRPLLGDFIYGAGRNPFRVEGQLLHAGILGFTHPKTGHRLVFESPLPDKFDQLLTRLRKA